MKVVQLVNGRFAENTFLILDPGTGDCAVVDPGEDTDLIEAQIEAHGAAPRAVWLTHAHVDHVAGVGAVTARYRVPVYLHPADRPLYDGAGRQALSFGFTLPGDPLPAPDHALQDGDTLALGALRFQVIHTPGHTPGGVSLHGQGAVFTGDALFQGSIGRTDFPGGDTDTLLRSIRERLLSLPDETVVYSGHGPATTIGRERRSNTFLTGAVRLL